MKNKLLITVIVMSIIASINVLKAQQWNIKTTTFPSCYTQSNGFCVINNKAYIGVGTQYCHDWWEFDPINNTTIQKASFSLDSTNSYPTCFSIGNYGYLMGETGKFYRYDPVADSWTQKTSFPINFPNGDSLHNTHNCTFVINGKGYVAGYEVITIDYSYTYHVYDLYEYDPINDSWQNKGTLPDSAYGFTGFTINNLGYIVGGDRFLNTPPLAGSTLYEYNPTSNSWTKKATCPQQKVLSRGFVIGSKFYYGTGIHLVPDPGTGGNSYLYEQSHATFQSYDQPTDSWQHLAPLPDSTMWDEGVGFAINGKGYLGLGDCWEFSVIPPVTPVNGGAGYYRGIWEYDPSSSNINDFFKNNTVSIYPNPFSSHTTLKIGNSLNNATLTMENIFGQTVKQITPITIGAGQTVILSRDNLASGLYFLRLTEDNKTFATEKLVITD